MSKERRVVVYSGLVQADGSSNAVAIDGMIGAAYLNVTSAGLGTFDCDLEEFNAETNQWYTTASFTQLTAITGSEKIVLPTGFENRFRVSWDLSTPGSPGWDFIVAITTKESDD